jgi:hypothetical protein
MGGLVQPYNLSSCRRVFLITGSYPGVGGGCSAFCPFHLTILGPPQRLCWVRQKVWLTTPTLPDLL